MALSLPCAGAADAVAGVGVDGAVLDGAAAVVALDA